MDTALIEFLQTKVPSEYIFSDEPMEKHTTFRVGGSADCFVEIGTVEELSSIIRYLNQTERNYIVLGNGSNVLVGDKGFRGVVLHMGKRFSNIVVDGTTIKAQAGAMLSVVSAAKHSLTGLEFAAGIPGTIGGAIVMNAGAYDGEMKQVVQSVTVLSENGEVMVLSNENMNFGYRTSVIKKRPFIVLETELVLQEGNVSEIEAKMADFNERRRSKQPLEFPSAGSTFKRPEGNFAGKLIMDAGLRGFRIGGAQVSEKHCGFIINQGNATAADISELMDEVTERVKERFFVTLEPEVIRIGEF